MTVDLETIATHEAAHAVMRWLRCLPATELTADVDGGLCAGTGRFARDEDLLLVALAGFAFESGYGFAQVDFAASVCDDFDHAREILAASEWLRTTYTPDGVATIAGIDDALARHFARACEMLVPHADVVERLGLLLANERRLSARRVSAILREYGKSELKGR